MSETKESGHVPIWAEEDGSVRGFMDMVDFECELGMASGGNRIFPSEEDCAEHKAGCIDQCGMVEVEVRFVRVVRESRFPQGHLRWSVA